MYLNGNEVRKKENFNLDWYFCHDGEGKGIGRTDTTGFEAVKLPHDWSLYYPWEEQAPSCASGAYVETGIGWYRKVFDVNPQAFAQGRVFIHFEGVYMNASVWINKQYLGGHVYGYTPFFYDITPYLQAHDNVLDIKVDNSAQPGSRWYSGSGITRNVWLVGIASPIHIAPFGVWVQTRELSEGRAVLGIETTIHEEGAPKATLRVDTDVFSPRGMNCLHLSDTRLAGARIIFQQGAVEAPIQWDVDHPALYDVVTRLYADDVLIDEYHTPVGLRTAIFDKDRGFLLNDRPLKLNGVCLHHDGGCMGAAVPAAIWQRRLSKLKEMGVNAIRTAHNPPDTAFLDLCDRMGFLVMDEAFDEWRYLKYKELGSNAHDSHGYSRWFDTCHEEDLRRMLLRDRNHPSIILWSIGNEVPDQTSPDGFLTARNLKSICKSLDAQRPVTQANDQIAAQPRAAREDFLNELDVVGYNYVGRWRSRKESYYGEDRRKHPDWCILGTENPGLGGTRGHYQTGADEHGNWWRLPYYAAPVEISRLLRYTMTHDYVAGDFMWTGIDYLGEAQWPAHASGTGVLDTCGFEKDSYYFYQSIWRQDKKVVHLLPHWNLNIEHGTIVQVLGYTNCDSAELFLNGKSYGRKATSYPAYGMTNIYGHFDKEPVPVNTNDLFLEWDVPYEPGCIELVGYVGGTEAARHTLHTAGEPAVVRVAAYEKELSANGLDVGQLEISLLDRDGNLCPQAQPELTITVEGAAELVGIDNGDPQGMESLKGSRIHAFAGQAFAVARSKGTRGECLVRVTADGLEGECSLLFQ